MNNLSGDNFLWQSCQIEISEVLSADATQYEYFSAFLWVSVSWLEAQTSFNNRLESNEVKSRCAYNHH